MRKKKDKKKIIILIALIIFLLIGIIINFNGKDRNLTIFEKAIKDSIYSVEKVISLPIDYVKNKITEKKEKDNMYDKYSFLKEELEKYQIYKNENDELKKQLEEMKKVLELNKTLYEYDYLNATVIARDLNDWNNTIVINKGENNGITINMPVIVKEGLIGKVISTTSFTSTVRLLTANNSNDKISVKIKDGEDYMYGILNGYDNLKNRYIIEGVSNSDKIELDSVVTTTGMGDIFPAGITIGTIKGISTDSYDLANILEVESKVDFNNINYVTILKRGL